MNMTKEWQEFTKGVMQLAEILGIEPDIASSFYRQGYKDGQINRLRVKPTDETLLEAYEMGFADGKGDVK